MWVSRVFYLFFGSQKFDFQNFLQTSNQLIITIDNLDRIHAVQILMRTLRHILKIAFVIVQGHEIFVMADLGIPGVHYKTVHRDIDSFSVFYE